MNPKKIGEFIAQKRKEKGLNQKQLADKLYITDRAISKWETGRGIPDISIVDSLAKELDVEIIELLQGKEQKENDNVNSLINDSLKYGFNNAKEKTIQIVNTICITIFVIICSSLLFFNLRSTYMLNRTYTNNGVFAKSEIEVNNLKSKIDLIRNNQGIYTDEEYNTIIRYVDGISAFANYQFDFKLINQETLTFKEMTKYQSSLNPYSFFGLSYPKSVYDFLIKYDVNVYKRGQLFASSMYQYIELTTKLNTNLVAPYYYNRLFDKTNLTDDTSRLIYNQYTLYNMTLNDILSIGGLDENA